MVLHGTMDAATIVVEFNQQLNPPKVDVLAKDATIHKGSVLCKRKSITQLLKDEEQRLELPDIKAKTKMQKCVPNKMGKVQKGYTFRRSSVNDCDSSRLDEDQIERILLLTSLESNADGHNIINKNNKPSLRQSLEARDRPLPQEQIEVKTATNDEQSTHVYQRRSGGELNFAKGSNKRKLYEPKMTAVRTNKPMYVQASMCTQSFNSLCTELAMFKDAFKAEQVEHASTQSSPYQSEGRQNSPSWSSRRCSVQSVGDPTFAIFKNKRQRHLLASSRESRHSCKHLSERQATSLCSSLHGLAASSPLRIESDKQHRELTINSSPHNNKTDERKGSVASEGTNECCECVKPPHVQFKLKDNSVSDIKEKMGLQSSYACYSPKRIELNKVQMNFPETPESPQRGLNLPRIPCKPVVAETHSMRRQTKTETCHSSVSDPEISQRKSTKNAGKSHEWPRNLTLSDSSTQVSRRALMNYKCNEWLDECV